MYGLHGETKAVLEALKGKLEADSGESGVEVAGEWTMWDVIVRHVAAYHGAYCEEWLDDLTDIMQDIHLCQRINNSLLEIVLPKTAPRKRLERLLKRWGLVRERASTGAQAGQTAVDRVQELAELEAGCGEEEEDDVWHKGDALPEGER